MQFLPDGASGFGGRLAFNYIFYCKLFSKNVKAYTNMYPNSIELSISCY